jgi:TolB-like protein
MRNLPCFGAVCLLLLGGFGISPEGQAREIGTDAALHGAGGRNKAGRGPNIANFAAEMASRVAASGCKGYGCTVVVSDFTFPDGKTSRFGKQLSDEVSDELANGRYNLKVIDRERLQKFLDEQRLQVNFDDRATVRWVLHQLDARFMVLGTMEYANDGPVSLSGRLVDEHDKKYVLLSTTVDAGPPDSAGDLAPASTLTPLPRLELLFKDRNVEVLGVSNATPPTCAYRLLSGGTQRKDNGDCKSRNDHRH